MFRAIIGRKGQKTASIHDLKDGEARRRSENGHFTVSFAAHYGFRHSRRQDRRARARRLDMRRLPAIEGCPLRAEEIAIFEMFEREGWSFERRRRYIAALFNGSAASDAAE